MENALLLVVEMRLGIDARVHWHFQQGKQENKKVHLLRFRQMGNSGKDLESSCGTLKMLTRDR